MKKMMMNAVMAIVCLTASAQNEVGQLTLQPKVGLNFANLSGANYATTGSTTENSNIMVDFALGVEAEYGLAKNFSVAAGICIHARAATTANTRHLMATHHTVGTSFSTNLVI